MTKPTKTGSFEIDLGNVQAITRDQLKDADKDKFEAHMRYYEELCLESYGQTKGGVFKKSLLPTPKQITFLADPESLKDMMTKAMHQIMTDQAKVFANMVQNSLIEALKKRAEGGYLGPAYI
jgi:CRISPR type IV-associated protein Csf3